MEHDEDAGRRPPRCHRRRSCDWHREEARDRPARTEIETMNDLLSSGPPSIRWTGDGTNWPPVLTLQRFSSVS